MRPFAGAVALLMLLGGVPIPWNADKGNAGECLISGGPSVEPDWGACGGDGGGLPAGLSAISFSGTCPTGWAEVAGASGKFLLGTVAANADQGGTGGSDNITPAGTVSQPTFAGTPFSSVINHTHTVTVTDPGHTHTIPVGATDDTAAPFDRSDAGTNASGANATTETGSKVTGVSATTANPAGGVASITPAGTVSQPTFSGTQFDNRPAFLKVIFCEKS